MSWDTRDFERGLDAFARQVEAEIEREVRVAGETARAEMVGKVEKDSGETAASITLETGRDAEGPYAEWRAGGAAVPNEFGTSKMRPKPFFRGPIVGAVRNMVR